MPFLHYFYEFTPLYLAQVALTIWMLVDANRRGVDQYWFWIIVLFQPLGAWAYFFAYKVKDFSRGSAGLGNVAGLFHRRPSLKEVRYRAEQSPTPANRLELGERLIEEGVFEEAIPHLEAMLAREPDHIRALFRLAQAHRGLGHLDRAVEMLKRTIALQINMGDYESWHTLIAVCDESGDRAAAVEHCRGLVQRAPFLKHRCLLAEHLLEAGENEEAQKVLEQGIEDYHFLTGPGRRRDRRWVGQAKRLLKEIG